MGGLAEDCLAPIGIGHSIGGNFNKGRFTIPEICLACPDVGGIWCMRRTDWPY